MELTTEQIMQLRAGQAARVALRRDYAKVCAAAWDLLRIMQQGDPVTVHDAATFLWVVLRQAQVQCACKPPGSAGDSCTGHCCRVAPPALSPGGTATMP
jgi:hypothetical protein